MITKDIKERMKEDAARREAERLQAFEADVKDLLKHINILRKYGFDGAQAIEILKLMELRDIAGELSTEGNIAYGLANIEDLNDTLKLIVAYLQR